MKTRKIMKTSFSHFLSLACIALATSFSVSVSAQTAGTLTFSFTPVTMSPGYSGTRNVLAVWIQTSANGAAGFVKTKLRYAGGGTSDHLPTWSVNAGGTAGNCLSAAPNPNVTDATTGATLSSFTAKSITWDGKNVVGLANGTTVADGAYRVAIQETWNHGTTGTVTTYFAFTKGPTEDKQTPANTANFTGITLDWLPSTTVTNTITTGTISGGPFCAGQTGINIPYTAVGTFNSGNTFTAQLSSSTGAFTTPLTIGVTSTTSGTIVSTTALPSVAGTAYRIRVISSNPVITGTDNGTNLTINAAPTTANAGPAQTVCATTATMAGNTPSVGTGSWSRISGTGTITTSSSPTSTITGLGAGANTFRWTISSAGCTSSTSDVIITSVASPTTANAGPAQTACATTATMAGNTPSVGTGLWSLVSGAGTITTPTSPTSTITGLGAGANTFSWTISNTGCTSSTSNVIITQSGTITTSNAGTDQKVCASTATLAGNTASTGTGLWSRVSGTGTITTPTSPTSGLTGLGIGDNIFRWTISNGTCTPSTDDVIISSMAQPTTSTAGPAQTVCTTTATMAGNTPSVGTGLWSLVSGAGTITAPSNPTSTITGLGTGSNTFSWTISNSPCSSSSSNVIITLGGTITIAAAGSDQSVCSTSATLAGNAPSAGTGLWSRVTGTGTITNASSPTSTVTGLGAGSNTFRWTISNGTCTPTTDDVIITRVLPPTTSIAGTNQTVCDSAILSANAPVVGTGTWSVVSGSGTFVNGSSPTTAVKNVGFGTNVFRWTISNSCSSTTSNVTIVGNCSSNTSIVIDPVSGSPYCFNTSYNLPVTFVYTGTFTGYFTAELSDAAGNFSSAVTIGYGTSSPIAAVIPSGTITGNGYRIRVKNTNPITVSADNGTDLEINDCSAIITDSIYGSPFCATTSYDMIVPFTTTGGYSGAYIAELSDTMGMFDFPTVIGYSYSNPIYATVPSGFASGNNYRVRVSNNSLGIQGSNNGKNLSINNCSLSLPMGIFENSAALKIKIYPNPNQGSFKLINYEEGKITIDITNALGESILRKELISVQSGECIPIEIPFAKAGLYFIKIQNGLKVRIGKISIN